MSVSVLVDVVEGGGVAPDAIRSYCHHVIDVIYDARATAWANHGMAMYDDVSMRCVCGGRARIERWRWGGRCHHVGYGRCGNRVMLWSHDVGGWMYDGRWRDVLGRLHGMIHEHHMRRPAVCKRPDSRIRFF